MRLLLVEDSARLGELLSQALGHRGFVSDHVLSLADADAAIAVATYDAIVLDIGLPDGDGVGWLNAQRHDTLPPTLLLTARNSLNDRIAGLDAGADDYLSKPFEVTELAARLRALLRRPGVRSPRVVAFGPFRYDCAARTLHIDGVPLLLPRRELELMELLIRRAGTVVDRAAIENALYDLESSVTPNAIDASLSRLRRKLDERGAGARLVTIKGVGYLLRGD